MAHAPATLARDGRVLERALLRERVTRAELESAIRATGCSSIDDVASALLEPDGSITVVRRQAPDVGQRETLTSDV